MVYGGIHSTLFPDECHERGEAHAAVRGDGDHVWATVLADCEAGNAASASTKAAASTGIRSCRRGGTCCQSDKYMWGSVQTVRGCPKHCSFCSVWRTDGQKPRQRGVDAVVAEVVELRKRGFRFIVLADDNFYPVTQRRSRDGGAQERSARSWPT